MNDTLMTSLRKLRLSGLLQSLEIRLQEARGNNLGHAEFLELIVQDELNIRQQRFIERRTRAVAPAVGKCTTRHSESVPPQGMIPFSAIERWEGKEHARDGSGTRRQA